MNANIRQLKKEDRASLEAMLSDTTVFYPEETVVALELIDIALGNPDQTDYYIYVYEEDGLVLGYHCTGKRPLTDGTYDLYWIVVAPGTTGKGIGSKLLVHAESFVKSENGRWLLAETSSRDIYEPTRSFYLKNGYPLVSSIPDFYAVGDALMIYGKKFIN